MGRKQNYLMFVYLVFVKLVFAKLVFAKLLFARLSVFFCGYLIFENCGLTIDV